MTHVSQLFGWFVGWLICWMLSCHFSSYCQWLWLTPLYSLDGTPILVSWNSDYELICVWKNTKYLISPPSSTQSLITNFHLIHISPLGTVYFGVLHFFRANMLIIITVLFFQNAFPPQTQKRILQRPDTEIFKVGRANWGRMSFVSDRDLQLHSAFIIIPPHSATLLCGVCLFINIPHWLSWAQCSI